MLKSIEISSKQIPSKAEIKKIFIKHKLDLSFPNDAEDGSTVTDWNYWYNYTSYNESDLKKFVEIINNYYDIYEIKTSGTGGSVDIYKIIK